MSDLLPTIPPAARDFLDSLEKCTSPTRWTNGTWIYPLTRSKIVFQGVVRSGDEVLGQRIEGKDKDTAWYLIVYQHPQCKPGMFDTHWFNVSDQALDVDAVRSEEVKGFLPVNNDD